MVEGKPEILLTQHNLEKKNKPKLNPQQQKAQAHQSKTPQKTKPYLCIDYTIVLISSCLLNFSWILCSTSLDSGSSCLLPLLVSIHSVLSSI